MPIGKYKVKRLIDTKPTRPFATSGADAATAGGVDTGVPPAPPKIPAPTITSLTASIMYSDVTPRAKIAAVWQSYETSDLETYRVQVATDSGFTSVVGVFTTGQNQASATIFNLAVLTTYYVRVATVIGDNTSDWSTASSTTTPADTTVPAVPTSTAGSFIGIGDLLITWTNPTSLNFRDVEIAIWNSSGKTVQLALVYNATGHYIWTAAQNLAATSGAGDPSVYVELRSRSFGNVYSAAVVVGTITKTVPTTPGTIAQSWSGDTGAAGADWTISWAAQADAAYYTLSINSLTARRVYGTTYTYTLDRNISDNTSADPTLAYSLIAVDGLLQSSTAATGAATNAAPAAPTVSLLGGIGQAVAAISTVPAADFAAWEYVWKRDGSTVRTLESKSNEQQYEMSAAADSGAHSWTVVVRQKDLFGQYSSTTTSSAAVVDALTVDYLRAGLAYTDSDSNTGATLAVLKDNVTVSGGVSYAA
jgi:hypothetical protein